MAYGTPRSVDCIETVLKQVMIDKRDVLTSPASTLSSPASTPSSKTPLNASSTTPHAVAVTIFNSCLAEPEVPVIPRSER
jgi:hypothetical protein